MVDAGKVAGGAGTGAAIGTAIMPGWGTAIGAIGGGLYGLFSGDGNNAAPAPPPSQYGGNPLTSQLAAQQYAAGLQQQQAQNAREAALYGQANGNFDVANAAQLRAGPAISSSLADKQRQLAALGGTNAAIGNVNATGQQLTALGTRPMGASYAEAQLHQGQDAAMAQQLSMARSGRSLGSGQAAMQQAAFNNAALTQQTNMAAANARIQEQNAYNQFQAGALGAAGQQYGAAGALSGQAGNQATGIRQGNEQVQLTNAQLAQNQQGINNQTTGLYNSLGAQQQQLGMQANGMGQNAYQFGAQQASGALGAQLNADTGRLSATTATNIANQGNANQHDAANMNMLASGAGAIASLSGGGDAPVNPNNPSGSTSPYAEIGKASHSTDTSSDENQKKNITPMRPPGLTSPTTDAKNAAKYAGFSPADAAAIRAADIAAANGQDTYTANGKTNALRPHGDTPMDDQDLGKIAVTGEPQPAIASYAETVAALNNGYRASQFAPTDVLNRVPGAGAGHSASQDAVIAQMMGKPRSTNPVPISVSDANASIKGKLTRAPAETPMSGSATSMLGYQPSASAPVRSMGKQASPFMPAAPAAPPPAWGDVFNAPTLPANVASYLAGANPYPVAASGPLTMPGAPTVPSAHPAVFTSGYYDAPEAPSYGNENGGAMSSDARSKTRIREQAPDTAALDAAYVREQQAPAVDLRPAQGYSYEYRDPNSPGASPGRHVGPMAQDLEHTAAAGTVRDTPTGKQVDTPRLTMVNTAAISELQRKLQALEALGGAQPAPPSYQAGLYPQTRAPY